jgi:hypothetical protein
MTYSNDQTQIRAGLVNYIGALIQSSHFEDRAARQEVASILIEEALKLAQDEKGIIDMFTVKPLLRGCTLVFEQRINELSKLPKNTQVEKLIEGYKKLADTIKEIVSVV